MEQDRPPLNIWDDIEKVWVDRFYLVIEHSKNEYKITGIHKSDIQDVIEELPVVIKALENYHRKMVKIYSQENQK